MVKWNRPAVPYSCCHCNSTISYWDFWHMLHSGLLPLFLNGTAEWKAEKYFWLDRTQENRRAHQNHSNAPYLLILHRGCRWRPDTCCLCAVAVNGRGPRCSLCCSRSSARCCHRSPAQHHSGCWMPQCYMTTQTHSALLTQQVPMPWPLLFSLQCLSVPLSRDYQLHPDSPCCLRAGVWCPTGAAVAGLACGLRCRSLGCRRGCWSGWGRVPTSCSRQGRLLGNHRVRCFSPAAGPLAALSYVYLVLQVVMVTST